MKFAKYAVLLLCLAAAAAIMADTLPDTTPAPVYPCVTVTEP